MPAAVERSQDSREGTVVDFCSLQNSSCLEVAPRSQQRGNAEVVLKEVIGSRPMCCYGDCSQNRVDN